VTEPEVLLPADAARRLGVRTRVVVQAMYERTMLRVRLDDGTPGIPEDAFDTFEVRAG
jgi:hypothetical protein